MFAIFAADRLTACAASVVEGWLQEIDARSSAPGRIFPRRSLGAAAAAFLDALAHQLREPSLESPPLGRALERLRRLAELRRLQGEAEADVLRELDRLEERLLAALAEESAAYPGPLTAAEVLAVASRLSAGLRQARGQAGLAWRDTAVYRDVECSRLLQRYARLVRHEIRNHLSVMALAVRALREPRILENDSQREKILASLDDALQRIAPVADQMLAVMLGEAPPAGEAQPRPLGEILAEVIQDLGEFADHNGVRVEHPSDPPPQADLTRMRIALINLLKNAIERRDEGKPDRWVRVSLQPEPEAGLWRVEVADNGTGIDPDAVEHLFEEHYREPAMRRIDGDGWGLALAAEAARQLGGAAAARSAEGEGSTFSFTFRPSGGGL